MEEKLRRLIEAMPQTDDLSVDARKMLELLLKIRSQRLSGSVTIHCQEGRIQNGEERVLWKW